MHRASRSKNRPSKWLEVSFHALEASYETDKQLEETDKAIEELQPNLLGHLHGFQIEYRHTPRQELDRLLKVLTPRQTQYYSAVLSLYDGKGPVGMKSVIELTGKSRSVIQRLLCPNPRVKSARGRAEILDLCLKTRKGKSSGFQPRGIMHEYFYFFKDLVTFHELLVRHDRLELKSLQIEGRFNPRFAEALRRTRQESQGLEEKLNKIESKIRSSHDEREIGYLKAMRLPILINLKTNTIPLDYGIRKLYGDSSRPIPKITGLYRKRMANNERILGTLPNLSPNNIVTSVKGPTNLLDNLEFFASKKFEKLLVAKFLK